jgi:hypothetical protein
MDTVVAVVADTHCGSMVGLIPDRQFQLDPEGFYSPSKGQKFLWNVWQEYWELIAAMRKGKQLVIVFNGDSIQGVDARFTAIISKRAEEHETIHIECMDYALKTSRFNRGKGDRLFYVRGTERHSEPGAQAEERIATDLGAEQREGRYSNVLLRLPINGVMFDFMHKREKIGGRVWTEDNSLFYAAKDWYFRIDRARKYKAPFDVVVVGSHYHEWVPPITYRGKQGNVTCVITPAFQLMTGYSLEVTKGMRNPTIGALAFTVLEDGSWDPFELIYEPDPAPAEPL